MKVLGMKMTLVNIVILFLASLGIVYVVNMFMPPNVIEGKCKGNNEEHMGGHQHTSTPQ